MRGRRNASPRNAAVSTRVSETSAESEFTGVCYVRGVGWEAAVVGWKFLEDGGARSQSIHWAN